MADVETTTLPTPIPTPLNVTALAKRFGVARSTIQRRIRKGWTPPAKVQRKPRKVAAPDAPLVPQVVQHEVQHPLPQPLQPGPKVIVEHHGSRITGLLLATTALTLAGVGLLTNAQFAASLGQTPVASTLLAALGLAIDVLALILPCTATVLWRGQHRLASLGAWAMWAGAVTVTLITAAGFAAGNIGDAVTARAAKVNERAELTARIETLQQRHKEAIGAAERARAAECAKVGPICRQRESTLAAVLADPETDLKAAVAALASLPSVVAGDPAGEMISAWSDGAISATAVHRARIAGLTVMPATAGLLLSFAWLVGPARRPSGG